MTPNFYYKDALKSAQKEFHHCTSQGEYPYPAVLDDFITDNRLNRGVNIGYAYIPMEFIVGTRTSGRTKAFARNFMPLMAENTEFASKWQALCQAHLDEGIRDAVKVYEYMNRYYVEEGNKRVSVLKYFEADSVYAQVIRIYPEQNGSREVELYNEFVEFYKHSKINYLEFSQPGSYEQLSQLTGKDPDALWSDDERSEFSAVYYRFRKAYEASGGNKLNSTVGDAMLAFIQVYGYQTLHSNYEPEIKKMISKVWEEIALRQEEDPIDVKLSPEEVKPGLLTKMLSVTEKKKKKVAFVHDRDPITSGWTRGHEEGREHVQRVLGDTIETTSYFHAMDDDPLQVIETAIADGNTIIFTSSPRLLPAALRSAVEHQDVTILNCSLNTSHRYIRTYYARMYEAKFVVGAIAGALAGSDRIGYVCDYPIFGQIAGINAFALGAQMVNPRAKVYLEWSGKDGAEGALKRLTDQGIRLISSQDQTKRGADGHSSFGLSLITEGNQVILAVPVWQWGIYYEALLRRIQDKSFQTEYAESSKALNYYWGMSSGVIELQCSEKIPPSTRNLAEMLQANIRAGLSYPFTGTFYTQSGEEIEGELTMDQIVGMDWLAENVEGSIPVYNELNEVGKSTVEQVGVEQAVKDKKES